MDSISALLSSMLLSKDRKGDCFPLGKTRQCERSDRMKRDGAKRVYEDDARYANPR